MINHQVFNAAFRQLLLRDTAPAGGVRTGFDRKHGLPQTTFQRRGSFPWRGYHQGEAARMQVFTWGEYPEDAANLYTATRNVLLPPETPAEGYYGTETVVVGGVTYTVNFSGAALNAGPDDLVDPPTDLPYVESYFLVGHY